MSDQDQGSVTTWINLLKHGDHDAAQRLWERYFGQLVRLARSKLKSSQSRDAGADEEDAVLSAFDSFCEGATQGRFPKLKDRDDLWRLLVVITSRKVSDQVVRHRRKKRGSGKVVNESALSRDEGDRDEHLGFLVGNEPTPEFAAMIAEEFERLLHILGDDSIRQVAIWRLEGYTREEIAHKLDCSPRTVAYKVEFIRKSWMAQDSG